MMRVLRHTMRSSRMSAFRYIRGDIMVIEVKVYCGAKGKMAGVSHISTAAGDTPTCKSCKLGISAMQSGFRHVTKPRASHIMRMA